jgi:general stress protein 26
MTDDMKAREEIKTRFWKCLSDSPFLMIGLSGQHEHSIPMNAQLDKDANGAFWFFTSKDNRLARAGDAMAQFAAKDHGLFACISGTLVPETDRTIMDKLWNNSIAAWYDGGKDDPNLLLLRYDLDDAEIWTADMGIKGIFKMVTGMKMKSDDLGEHAEVML